MITSAANAGWPDDISLEERYAECALPVPCVVRSAKIATVDVKSAALMGRLPHDLFAQVMNRVTGKLGL